MGLRLHQRTAPFASGPVQRPELRTSRSVVQALEPCGLLGVWGKTPGLKRRKYVSASRSAFLGDHGGHSRQVGRCPGQRPPVLDHSGAPQNASGQDTWVVIRPPSCLWNKAPEAGKLGALAQGYTGGWRQDRQGPGPAWGRRKMPPGSVLVGLASPGGQHIFLPLDKPPPAFPSLSAPEEADRGSSLPGVLAAFQPPEPSPAASPRSPQGGPGW